MQWVKAIVVLLQMFKEVKNRTSITYTSKEFLVTVFVPHLGSWFTACRTALVILSAGLVSHCWISQVIVNNKTKLQS